MSAKFAIENTKVVIENIKINAVDAIVWLTELEQSSKLSIIKVASVLYVLTINT
jgi:hypothetical protein